MPQAQGVPGQLRQPLVNPWRECRECHGWTWHRGDRRCIFGCNDDPQS